MSSTCSTLSLFSHLPSRNPSFSVYDGGESSSYSHESLEIEDSVENLLVFTKLGYSPYLMPIHLHHNSKHDTTTSSSDEDMSHHDYGRLGRRKRSSGATNTDQSHDTPRHKDASDNSNSSCDSDQLQRSDPNYHGKSDVHQRGGIPVHRNESISISDMEKYATDVEIDQKAVDLQQRFGRVRYSSTGNVKICYSESSNTSMEDVSKN